MHAFVTTTSAVFAEVEEHYADMIWHFKEVVRSFGEDGNYSSPDAFFEIFAGFITQYQVSQSPHIYFYGMRDELGHRAVTVQKDTSASIMSEIVTLQFSSFRGDQLARAREPPW